MINDDSRVLTVAELTLYIKEMFAADPLLSRLRVSGEISNFKHHSSGHMYFTLKDALSSLRCVMFRSYNSRLTFRPAEGMRVVVGGRLSVYERDGQYQLYAESMAPEGVGSLYAAFLALKNKLNGEGLFEQAVKKSLPRIPLRVGLVTSPTGAAVRDILTTIKRRFPQVEVLIVPVLVQGPESPAQVVQAIEFLNNVPGVDVMVLARGGGAIEELWAFNEEMVARAIYASRVPVVSAIGHETDFTIADFVADVRAATPTAAAELIVPDQREILQLLGAAGSRMSRQLVRRLQQDRRYLEKLAASPVLARPLERLEQKGQQLDMLESRLAGRLSFVLQGCKGRVDMLEEGLRHLSPTAVLARGFAICLDNQGRVVRDAALLSAGDEVNVRVDKGSLDATVNRVYGSDNND
jgi:exodeoxyribonuclease VII large subunit